MCPLCLCILRQLVPLAARLLTPCDPENHRFRSQNSLLRVDTPRREFLRSFAVPALVCGVFSAQNLAQAAPNIEPKTPSESQRKPSAFGARFRRNSATRVSRIRRQNISDFAQRTVFGLARPHLVGLPHFQRLSAARSRCLSSYTAPRRDGRHVGAPRRAARPRKTRFCAAF